MTAPLPSAISTINVRVEFLPERIALVTLDMPGKSANVLCRELQDNLESILDVVCQTPDLVGCILFSAKPRIFVAGADIQAIVETLDWPDESIIEFCKRGQDLYDRFHRLPCPSIAAIHGACVGGGMELALGCDWRLATRSSQTFLGLPEVKLGLIPGWAGTVRLPRLIGLKRAADYLLSGRNIPVEEAQALKLVDSVCEPEQLLAAAKEILLTGQWQGQSLVDMNSARSMQDKPAGEIPADLEQFRQQELEAIAARRDIHDFAPHQLLDHMIHSCRMSFAAACHSEALAMAKVYGSPSSRGLLNLFFLNEHNRKNPGTVNLKLTPPPLQKIGIVGIGVMGQAIAQMAGQCGLETWVYDTSADACNRLQKNWNHRQPLRIAAGLADFGECQLVIESTLEETAAKRELLQALSSVVPATTVIATNTSAIPLKNLQSAVTNASRFCGIHFCHPQLMQLIEVIGSSETSPETLAAAVHWCRQWRKTPVVVADAAGFVVNRLLAAMLESSLELLTAGNRHDVIDAAMRDFGFPGGPFEIMDVIGLDTVMHAGREMVLAGHQHVSRSPIVPRMVKLGRLGRKSLMGFYRYNAADAQEEIDPSVEPLLRSYQTALESRTTTEIQRHILLGMAKQAKSIVAAGLVADRRDLDICAIYGLGFPAHVGGLLFWSDQQS